MAKYGDEAKVGVMVMGAGAILIITIFMMMHYNPLRRSSDEYTIRLKFAGGLEKDNVVRFGGMRKGKVTSVRLSPGDSATVELGLSLETGTPVRTDSVARLAALNALGENYIEITPGKGTSPLLAPGQTIRSEETPEFTELLAKISALSDDAGKLIADLDRNINRISDSADTLLGNLNDATGPQNRKKLSSILDGADGAISKANDLIAKSSPKIDAIASNLQSTTDKLPALMQRIEEATAKTNTLIEHLDGMLAEDRPLVKQDLEALEATLADARRLLGDVSAALTANRDDIDLMVESFRRSSENLQEFTNVLKRRPYSLIRVKNQPDRTMPK